jgi:hypothetical protein
VVLLSEEMVLWRASEEGSTGVVSMFGLGCGPGMGEDTLRGAAVAIACARETELASWGFDRDCVVVILGGDGE